MHANNSYTLTCRQYKTNFLELNFDKIQATLRVGCIGLSFVDGQQDNSTKSFPRLVFKNEALPLLPSASEFIIPRCYR